jgi:hypothetical protein
MLMLMNFAWLDTCVKDGYKYCLVVTVNYVVEDGDKQVASFSLVVGLLASSPNQCQRKRLRAEKFKFFTNDTDEVYFCWPRI